MKVVCRPVSWFPDQHPDKYSWQLDDDGPFLFCRTAGDMMGLDPTKAYDISISETPTSHRLEWVEKKDLLYPVLVVGDDGREFSDFFDVLFDLTDLEDVYFTIKEMSDDA